ncbi:MAG: acyl carrier protein [Clostridia bacterium]|jgi:acyl carrier protein|nr:acyl carrier protein [Clostridia bacterium]MBO7360026.1 acyl carrier protein [Clostridia bacterium]MCR4683354.1 acyl carrier protein [Clostridiales bacterium]
MYESLKKLLAKQLRIDESRITPESDIKKDLGADSLDILTLLMTVEEDWGITIPDEQLMTFKTVADIVAYLDTVKK